MQLHKNKVIIASAGSRKTTRLVEEALAVEGKRVLLTTYTNENLDQIRNYIVERCGHVPANISISSWFTFLLHHGVRPYQNRAFDAARIRTIAFKDIPKALRYVKKSAGAPYFLTGGPDIYRDRIADFVCHCDDKSDGAVMRRIARIYDCVFIDELQDLAGYDLHILERLFAADVSVIAVGDPRQATFMTNHSQKNKQFTRSHITDWIEACKAEGLITVGEMTECWRSNQKICDFADALYPQLPKTRSKNTECTGHDGLFIRTRAEVPGYMAKYSPVVLRYKRTSDTMGLPALNIGMTKGRTYERVLIFPTKPMEAYLHTGDLASVGDVSRLYVAVTRAKYSVAFVVG